MNIKHFSTTLPTSVCYISFFPNVPEMDDNYSDYSGDYSGDYESWDDEVRNFRKLSDIFGNPFPCIPLLLCRFYRRKTYCITSLKRNMKFSWYEKANFNSRGKYIRSLAFWKSDIPWKSSFKKWIAFWELLYDLPSCNGPNCRGL